MSRQSGAVLGVMQTQELAQRGLGVSGGVIFRRKAEHTVWSWVEVGLVNAEREGRPPLAAF